MPVRVAANICQQALGNQICRLRRWQTARGLFKQGLIEGMPQNTKGDWMPYLPAS